MGKKSGSTAKDVRLVSRIFQIAGIWGVLILVPCYFLERKIGLDFPPLINHPEYYYGFLGVALAWQAAFFIIATDPKRFRPIMLAAILEKLSFAAAVTGLYLAHRTSLMSFMLGGLDVIFAVAFAVAYARTPKE